MESLTKKKQNMCKLQSNLEQISKCESVLSLIQRVKRMFGTGANETLPGRK